MEDTFKFQKSIRPRELKYHVVISFRDNGETLFVVKYYNRYKGWWNYEVWDEYVMDLNTQSGYKIVKQKKEKKK